MDRKDDAENGGNSLLTSGCPDTGSDCVINETYQIAGDPPPTVYRSLTEQWLTNLLFTPRSSLALFLAWNI
jgi:hypothetical protein